MTDKPPLKRPPTKGTRKGSGMGWGGSPKGEKKAVPLDDVRALRWDEARLQAKETRMDALKAVIWDIAQAASEPSNIRVMAADKLMDREEGKPTQRAEITAADGAPFKIMISLPDNGR